MKKLKESIIEFYKKHIGKRSEKEDKSLRKLVQDKKTGKFNWTEGEKPFKDEDIENIKVETDATERSCEPFRGNRFCIEFPGIPSYVFSSYNYLGTDKSYEKKLLSGNNSRNVKNDFSEFTVILGTFTENFDICDKFKELEEDPKIGDINIKILESTGVVLKTITIPMCEVHEIKAFRELDYKKDELLYGTIVVKHKQRKLL